MTFFISVFRAICLTFEKSIGPVFDLPVLIYFFLNTYVKHVLYWLVIYFIEFLYILRIRFFYVNVDIFLRNPFLKKIASVNFICIFIIIKSHRVKIRNAHFVYCIFWTLYIHYLCFYIKYTLWNFCFEYYFFVISINFTACCAIRGCVYISIKLYVKCSLVFLCVACKYWNHSLNGETQKLFKFLCFSWQNLLKKHAANRHNQTSRNRITINVTVKTHFQRALCSFAPFFFGCLCCSMWCLVMSVQLPGFGGIDPRQHEHGLPGAHRWV